MYTQSQTTYNEVEKIWYGNKIKPKYGPENSVGSIILEALQREPDFIGQIAYPTGKEYTNQELLLSSIRIAQHLEKLNIPQCEIIGICALNSDFIAPLVFGCLYRGLTISTLDPSFDKDGIKHIYAITKPKLMFCDGSIYHKIREAFDECGLSSTKIYTVQDHIENVPSLREFLVETQREHEFKCVSLKMGFHQVAAILCSSGTTGLPKGVCLSHANILHSFSILPPAPQRVLCFSTLYWLTGLLTLIGGTIVNYTRVISHRTFHAEDFLKIVKNYNTSMFIGPPSQMGMLLACSKLRQNDLLNLKLIFIGGSAVPYSLVVKLKEYVPDADVAITYSQTEVCTSIAAGLIVEDGNCGKISSNIELKIINDNNDNLGPDEIGEICTKTLYPWPGYYNNPQATANVYDSERWIHSGDLGYINKNGELYLVDRKKDILKYNNFHFYPTEIENVIYELSDVVEVCVFGIPDIIFTNLPAAAVVKAPGSNLSEDMVYEYVAKRMVHFKCLRGGVYFFDVLPKTASGKILRRKVTELCKN